jgi:hypothetical protein
MIGKSLRARYELVDLSAPRAKSLLNEALRTLAKDVVAVRARGEHMVACVVVSADRVTLRACLALGLEIKEGKSGVFGLSGDDFATLFPELSPSRLEWLAAPAGPRETKVFLLAGGLALLSLTIEGGKVTVDVHEPSSTAG